MKSLQRSLVVLTFLSGLTATQATAAEPVISSSAATPAAAADSANWTIRGGALFLHRSSPSPAMLVSTSGDASLLSADDIDFGTQSGLDLDVVRRLDAAWSIEGRYFQVGSWEDVRKANANVSFVNYQGLLTSEILSISPHPVTMSYSSLLRSAEMNARFRAGDRLTVLVGLRFVHLEDTLGIEQGTDFTHRSGTQNDLYGGQIGVEGLAWSRGRVRIEGWAKAGLYVNDTRGSYHFRLPAIPTVNADYSRKAEQGALVGDLGICMSYRVAHGITLRGSYQALLLDGVALASDQFKNSAAAGGPMAMTANGRVRYHGALVGVEVAW